MPTIAERAEGAIVGAAVGDALGAPFVPVPGRAGPPLRHADLVRLAQELTRRQTSAGH